jgi:hypothetical protein
MRLTAVPIPVLVLAAAIAAAAPSTTAAQTKSLAELARQEEARRKAIKKPAKVYTNEDLKGPRETSAPVVEAPAAATPSAPAAEKPPAEDPKRDRQYWQDRINAARAELDRSKVYLDALQSRINALSTDFVNRDDPAQRAVIEQDRRRALAEFERLKTHIQDTTKSIAAIEEEARRLGVPPGWLR